MKICVIGVGNIGMRYVQGISKTFPDAELVLIDGEARLNELADLDLDNVALLTSLDDVRGPLDLCIVATSCEPRLSIYKQCLNLDPRFIILEKYLFKSRQEFTDCLSLERAPTFVNQWMYGSKAFDRLFETPASSVVLTGSSWGLACNAVHWIDVFKRHLGIEQLDVGPGTKVSRVFPSKRQGYEEIFGELVFVDRHSEKTITLIDQGDPRFDGMQEIKVDDTAYTFDFKQVRHEETVVGHFPYLSEVVGHCVGQILSTGSCHLPSLEESIAQHLLIEDVLDTLDSRPCIT